jgi:uncharacterized protein
VVNEIYFNEYLRITYIFNEVYIESFKAGFPKGELNKLLEKHPEILITSFTILNNALSHVSNKAEKFGELKDKINIEISQDALYAYITFFIPTENERKLENRDKLVLETLTKAKKANINYGIEKSTLYGEIENGQKYILARGKLPVNGLDAKVAMYELQEVKPEIREDGSVNYYDLKLINNVKEGAWLGEKTDPTDGSPGINVYGNPIPALEGKNAKLFYDKNSVIEIYRNNKSILFSKISGVVHYIGDKIVVSNHLDILGDVDLATGNIKFDGYVSITGTVQDGFSVEATKDIEINGIIGIGNIKNITSTEGNIYIRGGVIAKTPVKINCAKSLYVKYLDNAVVSCGEKVNIGFYCKDSYVSAKEVTVESIRGQIIGGKVTADISISVSILGCDIEKRTIVEVKGFDKNLLNQEISDSTENLNNLRNELIRLKETVSYYNSLPNLNNFQKKEQSKYNERLLEVVNQIKNYEEKIKLNSTYINTKGDGEINITKMLYPNCRLMIKSEFIEITRTTYASTYFFHNSKIIVS